MRVVAIVIVVAAATTACGGGGSTPQAKMPGGKGVSEQPLALPLTAAPDRNAAFCRYLKAHEDDNDAQSKRAEPETKRRLDAVTDKAILRPMGDLFRWADKGQQAEMQHLGDVYIDVAATQAACRHYKVHLKGMTSR